MRLPCTEDDLFPDAHSVDHLRDCHAAGVFNRVGVLLPMTFAFNIILPRNRWFWPLFVLGNLTVLHSLEVIQAWDVIANYLWV